MRLGLGGGFLRTDLERPEGGRDAFGSRPRVVFDLGLVARPGFEIGADVGFGVLGRSDSLNAWLASRGREGAGAYTLVHTGLLVRTRWASSARRWVPFLRAGAGIAIWTLSAPDGLGFREHDPQWNAGGGVEASLHRRLALRAEGLYVGQAAPAGARHDFAAAVSLLLLLPRGDLEDASATSHAMGMDSP